MSNAVFPMQPGYPVTQPSHVPVSVAPVAPVSDFDPLAIAWRYKSLLLMGVVAGACVGHYLYAQLGPEYTATGKVLVSKRAHVNVREHEESTSGARGQHVALIMSPLIVERAVQLHQLDRLPSMAKSKDVVEDIVSSLKVQRSTGDDGSVMNILDITYKSSSRTDAKKVVDAIVAAYGEFLKESHQEGMTELVRLVDKANVNLRQQIDDAERKYEDFRSTAPIHLKQPTRGANGEHLPVSANVHQDNLLALDKERQTLLLRKAELHSQIQSFETAIQSGRPREELIASIQLTVPGSHAGNADSNNILSNPTLEPSRTENSDSQWLGLKLQEERLLLEYGQDWPEVQALRKQLAVIEQHYRIKGMKLPYEAPARATQNVTVAPGVSVTTAAPKVDLVGAYLFSLRQQFDAILRREAQLDRVYAAEYEQAQKLARFVETDRRYQEDLQRLNGMWGVIRTQAAQVDLLKDNHAYTLKSISPVRDQLSLKRLLKLYGAGLGSVLTFVLGIIFLREKSASWSTEPKAVRQPQPMPIAPVVPAPTPISNRNDAPAASDRSSFLAKVAAVLADEPATGNGVSVPVGNRTTTSAGPAKAKEASAIQRPGYAPPFEVLGSVPEFEDATTETLDGVHVPRLLQDPEAAESEAVRALSQNLLAASGARMIVTVISPEVGDGKTTLTANLAVSLAQAGKKVLAIDGDVLSPGLHHQFGLRNEIGLSEVIARELDLLTASRPTLVNGLSVLPSGSPHVSGTELAAWDLRPMLDEARREFDVVLIDTPSLMSSTFGSSVTQLATGAVFVWRPGQSAPEFVRRATDILIANSSPIIGAIPNRDATYTPPVSHERELELAMS